MSSKESNEPRSGGRLVLTFGRFQPPHVGHALLIDSVYDEAQRQNAEHVVILSGSHNKNWLGSSMYQKQKQTGIFKSHKNNENPLPIDRKLHYLELMFPYVRFARADELGDNLLTIVDAFKEAGYTKITAMFGGDRTATMSTMFGRYDMKINIKSAGDRDDKAADITGASATKMREAAVKGDAAYFVNHCNIGDMTVTTALEMMKEVRDGLWSSSGGDPSPATRHTRRPSKYVLRADEKPPKP